MPRRAWEISGFALIGVAILALLYLLVAPRVTPLPVYMTLPSLTLIDQTGKPYNLDQTRGYVVVLSPIYTHCPDICLLTTAILKQVREEIQKSGLEDQVMFVTVTIDPQRDTPDILQRFAGSFKIDFKNWVFLTGSQEQINQLASSLGVYVERVFYINKTPVPETALLTPIQDNSYLVNHTDRIFLVDTTGNVRAIPPGSRSDVKETVELIKTILKESREEK